MGAWIETVIAQYDIFAMAVAPYVGAWIETKVTLTPTNGGTESHPTWVRGLKLPNCAILFS